MFFDDFDLRLPPIQSFAVLYRRLPINNPFYYLFCLIALGVILCIVKHVIVRRGSSRIQYYITDIWTAILALMPAFIVLRDACDENQNIDWKVIGLFVVMFGSICGGIWVWLVLTMPQADEPPPGRGSHFISVLSGGFVGLLGVVASGFAFGLLPAIYYAVIYLPLIVFHALALWLALCIAMPPMFLASGFFIWFSKKAIDAFVR